MLKGQKKSNIAGHEKDFEYARQKFQQWRRNKTYREPIPEELWQLAIELSSRFLISQVARELSLNFMALKKRVIGNSELKKGMKDNPDSFVELKMLPDSMNIPKNSSCVMELTRVDGTNLKIYSAVGKDMDILRICEQFLKGR